MAKERTITHRTESKGPLVVVGLGYVGLPLCLLAEKKGYKVIGIDKDETRVKLVRAHELPFTDEKIARELAKSYIEATTDFRRIRQAAVVAICVPTPVYKDYRPDLRPVKSACRALAPYLQKGALVILESTVNPGVCEQVVKPLLERYSRLKAGRDFYLSHCPERINPGDKNWHVGNIPRVVGSLDEVGLQKTLNFYRLILGARIKPMKSLKEAEAVKIVENSFRDINIAFVNELAQSFENLGIDIVNVIDGAATKPFAFMPHYPGCGVGGHCIPVDPYYLIEFARQNGFYHDFLSLARRINNSMPEFTCAKLVEALNERKIAAKGARVAVLGLAYKSDVGDCRESPSFVIIESLKKTGAKVVTFDPFVTERSTAKNLDEALQGAAAAVVVTAHRVFKELSPEKFLAAGVQVVIDGRNCLDKEKFLAAGLNYKGIGR